jgi:carboxymethylenebutenolidase
MDAPGIREELRDMVRRLASVGYYVCLPNLYYRWNVKELGPFAGEANAPVRQKMMGLMEKLSISMVMDDLDSLIEHVRSDRAASEGPYGCVGYCMSGQFAVHAAARHPDRIAAAASVYGTRLVTEKNDSPHLVVERAHAELYFAWAEFDHYAPSELIEPLRAALEKDGIVAEVELYRGVEHGFAFPGRAAYNKDAAERHWERLFALFDRTLRPTRPTSG